MRFSVPSSVIRRGFSRSTSRASYHELAQTRRSGFSLPEMLIVLVIAGIVLSIGLPKFAAMHDQLSVRSAKRQLGAYLVATRASAIRQSTTTQFRYRGNRLWGTMTKPNGDTTAVTQLLRVNKTEGVFLSVDGADSTRADSIVYDARGFATYPAGTVIFTLWKNNTSDSLCVNRLGLIARFCGQ